jgi:hypothetical protein
VIYQCPATENFYDPAAVKRALLMNRFNEGAEQMNMLDPLKVAAGEALVVAAARKAFSLLPVDPKTGQGVPDATVLEAVRKFTAWLRGKGQAAVAGSSGAPCTGCPQDH